MALQVGIHKFTGRLDNVIGYRRNGKYFLRSMPDKVRQTAATKRAARHFGIASRKGKLVRNAFRPHLDVRYEGGLVNRLNKLFIQAGRNSFPDLRGFRFNPHTGLEKMFSIPPVFTVNGTLHIPAQQLEPQGAHTHLEVRLVAVSIDFTTQRVISTETAAAMIGLHEEVPFKGLTLSVATEAKGVLMISLQCRACKASGGVLYPSGDRRCSAADVIHLAVPADQLKIPEAVFRKAARKRFVFRKHSASSINGVATVKEVSPSLVGGAGTSSLPSFRVPQSSRGKPVRSSPPGE